MTHVTHTPESLARLARMWQHRADAQLGKSLLNGWNSRELEYSAQQYSACIAKRNQCWAEYDRLLSLVEDHSDPEMQPHLDPA